jgi:hypothetical protein
MSLFSVWIRKKKYIFLHFLKRKIKMYIVFSLPFFHFPKMEWWNLWKNSLFFTKANSKTFPLSSLLEKKRKGKTRKFLFLFHLFLTFYGDRGTWTLTIEKINGFSLYVYSIGLFLYLYLWLWLFESQFYWSKLLLFFKDSSHQVSAPFVYTKRFKIWKTFFSFFDIESIHFLNFFRKAQKSLLKV